MSKPTYLVGTGTLTASGLRNNATTSTLAGCRDCRYFMSQDRVSPESTMSSTITTCRPVMSRSRSLRMRTTPEDVVPCPYDETAMNSISVDGPCRPSARAKSAMNMTAPLSTQTSRMPPSTSAWSDETCFASSAVFSRICSSEMITWSMSASYQEPSAMEVSLPYQGCPQAYGASVRGRRTAGNRRVPPSVTDETDIRSDSSHRSLGHPNE